MNKLLRLGLFVVLPAIGAAQVPWQCTANTSLVPTVRGQGAAEPVADVIVTCAGGTGVATGTFFTDFKLSFNAPVASQAVGQGLTEALVLANVQTPSVIQYNANAISGVQTAPLELTFFKVQMIPQAPMTLRFTNLRIAASQSDLQPQLLVDVSQSSQFTSSFNFTQQVVANVQPGMTFDVRTCDDRAPVNNPIYSLSPRNTAVLNGGTGTVDFNVRFQETFPFDFRQKIAATQDPSLPGVVYNSESLFVNTQKLPATAGIATQGTRLLAAFHNVPAGVRLFVTTRPLNGASSVLLNGFLVNTDSLGAGQNGAPQPSATASCPSSGALAGISEIPVSAGVATAVWEISASDPQNIENASFGVVVVYAGTPAAGAVDVNGLLAPIATGARTSTPEFDVVDQTQSAFTVGSGAIQPLTITTTSLPDAFIGIPYNAQVQATGGSGAYVFTYSGTLPPGLTFTNGIISGTPTSVTSTNITVIVSDRFNGRDAKTFSLNVFRTDVTVAIGTRALAQGTVGAPYSQQIAVSGGYPPLSWTATGLPNGLRIDQKGVLSGTPSQTGTFQVNIIVKDAFGNGDNVLLPLTIVGGPLTLITDILPAATVGSAYSAPLLAGGGTPPYTFKVTGLPSGITFTNNSLTGKADAAGTSNVTVVVTDAANATVTRTLQLVVNPGPPQFTTTSLPPGFIGAPYSTTVTASGGTPPFTFLLNAPPAGFSIDPQTGQITGSFVNTTPVSLSVTVKDKNQLSSTQTFRIAVSAPTPIQITTAPALPPAFVGDTLNLPIGITGGVQPFTFAVTGGALPPGVTLDPATGTLKGTATSAGLVSFTITVTDAAKQTKAQTFTGQVLNPVSIPAQTLAGTVGSAFNGKINVTGGLPPFNIVIVGSAPAGLIVDPATGEFSGSPNAAGDFTLDVRVTDAANRVARQTIPMTIGFPTVTGVNVGGIPAAPLPGGQAQNLTVGIVSAFPAPVTGTLTLTFTPDAAVNGDDPNVAFSNGKRTATFNVKQGDTAGTFTDPNLGIQLGTVAGTISLATTLQSNGINVPCNCTPQKIVIPRTAPVIRSVLARRTPGGFTVDVTGFSSSRELISATFRFTGGNLQTTETTIQVGSVFGTYYQGAEGQRNGSLFTLTEPFTINGDQNAVTSVTVILTNTIGASAGTSATLQ